MLELLGIALSWWVVSLSGIMMPGPVSAMAVTEGARRGPVAGPLITIGHSTAEVVMLGLLALGLNRAVQVPAVLGTIGILGGAVLAWMGWGIADAARRNRLDPVAGSGAPGGRSLIRAGLLTTVSNPYWLLWWATIGAAYFVRFSRFGVAAILGLFFLGHTALDLGWNSFLALVVGAGRRRVRTEVFRLVLGVCGVFLLAMSGYFIYTGLRYLAQ